MDTKFAQALHMLVFIAETQQTVTSQSLAESVGTNASHIRKLTGLLKRAGLVETSQGKAGMTLARPKHDITLSDIYEAVYPDKRLLGIHQEPNRECPVGKHIDLVLGPTFTDIEQQLAATLRGKTLAELINELYRSHEATMLKGNS